MAVKTITIDMEAYTLLSRRKGDKQSFSDVIKAHFGARPTAADLRDRLRRIRLGADAIDQMDEVVAARRRSPARAAR
jgi:predicted CopG family antitoxin